MDFEAVRMNALKPGAGIALKPGTGNAPKPGAGIAPKPGAGIALKPKAGIDPSQGAGIARIQGVVIAPSQGAGDRSTGSIGSAANTKNGKSQEPSFSLRLSAIPCLLTCFSDHIRIICVFAYFAFLLTVAMPVAVIPLISSSASHRMELLVSPVLGSFVFPVLSEAEAAAAFFSHTAV